MEFFGPWNVVEDPAHGQAVLTLYLDVNEVPIDDGTITEGLAVRSVTPLEFRIKARPWHRTLVRPFACDVMPFSRTLIVEGVARKAERIPITIVLALALDVELDDSAFQRYIMERRQQQRSTLWGASLLDLVIVRVLDPALLPPLGEPVTPQEVLPRARWAPADAVRHDLELLREAGQLSSADEAMPALLQPDMRTEVITIIPRATGIDFTSDLGRWKVTVDWPAKEACGVVWQLRSPLRMRNPQHYEMLLVTTENVTFTYAAHRWDQLRDAFGHVVMDPDELLATDPLLLRVAKEPHHLLLPSEEDLWRKDLDVFRPDRRYGDPHAQMAYAMRTAFTQDPYSMGGVFVVPLAFVGGPVGVAAVALGAALTVGSIYHNLNERVFIGKYGADRAGIPNKLDDIDLSLKLAVVSLVMDAAVAVGSVTRMTLPLLKMLRGVHAGDIETVQHAVRTAPIQLRAVLGTLKAPVLAALIQRMSRATSTRTLLHSYVDVIHTQRLGAAATLLMDDMELQRVFTSGYDGFRVPELAELYEAYRQANVMQRHASSGLNAEQLAQLVLEPLAWVIRGNNNARKARIMTQFFGEGWRDLIKRYAPYLPHTDDVQQLVRRLGEPMDYTSARALRKDLSPASWQSIVRGGQLLHPMERELVDAIETAASKSFSRLFEFDHPLEGRFIRALAARHGLDPDQLLDYEHATVLLVPKNAMAATRMNGYAGVVHTPTGYRQIRGSLPLTGYDHYSKTRRLETLVAFGAEGEYTLQQIRDAHVFTIASLAGPNSPAIKLVDEACTRVATLLGQELSVGYLPKFEQFAVGKWKYMRPDPRRRQAMRLEQFLRERGFITERIGEAGTGGPGVAAEAARQ